MSKNKNRSKGIRGELYYKNEWKILGFDKCITSRKGNRLADDCGIDLLNIPFNVQIKSGEHKNLNVRQILEYMDVKIKEHFIDDEMLYNEFDKPNLLIHKKLSGKLNYRQIVYITKKDFYSFFIEEECSNFTFVEDKIVKNVTKSVEELLENNIDSIIHRKYSDNNSHKEYNELFIMTWENFKRLFNDFYNIILPI